VVKIPTCGHMIAPLFSASAECRNEFESELRASDGMERTACHPPLRQRSIGDFSWHCALPQLAHMLERTWAPPTLNCQRQCPLHSYVAASHSVSSFTAHAICRLTPIKAFNTLPEPMAIPGYISLRMSRLAFVANLLVRTHSLLV
jgi:hypothetical protein